MSEFPTKLTAAEIACTWTNYMNASLSVCVMGYFLKVVEDNKIKAIVQQAYDLATSHLDQLASLYTQESIPLPTGFSMEEDVNINAPRLYTDTFMLTYINHMAKVGLLAYGSCLAMTARKDVRMIYKKGLLGVSDLYDNSTEVALAKGFYVRPPYINYPTETDYVDTKKYLSGFSLFNEERPLNAIEITHLFMNIQTNLIGIKLALSFAQTTTDDSIRKWLVRGSEISQKHYEIFAKTLSNDNLQAPAPSDISVTNSTTSPFSNKLILYHMSVLTGAGSGNYAAAATASQRSDLILNYERLSLEVAKYSKDGVDIMIRNRWLEQPPGLMEKKK